MDPILMIGKVTNVGLVSCARRDDTLEGNNMPRIFDYCDLNLDYIMNTSQLNPFVYQSFLMIIGFLRRVYY